MTQARWFQRWPVRIDRHRLRITDGEAEAAVLVEVAVSMRQHDQGLMHRESLPVDAGMFFVFAEEQDEGFWMKDTSIPLTVAYIDRDGRVMELADLEPMSEEAHCPEQPYRYALEVNRGWFEWHGLGVGAQIRVEG